MAMGNLTIICLYLLACVYISVADGIRNKGVVIGHNDTIVCDIPDFSRSIGHNRIVWRIHLSYNLDIHGGGCKSILDSSFCNVETNSGLGSILEITNFALPGSTFFQCSSDNPGSTPVLGPDTILEFLVTGICQAEVTVDGRTTEYNSSTTPSNNVSFTEGDDVTISCLYNDALLHPDCSNVLADAIDGQVVFTAELAHDGCQVGCVGRTTHCEVNWILEVTKAATTVPAPLTTNLATYPPSEGEQGEEGTSPSTIDHALPLLIILLFVSFILLLIFAVGLALYLFLPACRFRRQRNDSHKQSLDNLQQPTYSVVAETMNQREGNGHGHDGIAGDARGETSGVEYDVCERQSVGRDADGSGSRNEVEYEYTDVARNEEVVRSDKKHVTEISQKNDGIEDGATADCDYSYVGEGSRSTATPGSTSNENGTNDDDSIPEYATVVKSRDSNPSTEKSGEPDTQPAESDSDIPEYAVVNKKK